MFTKKILSSFLSVTLLYSSIAIPVFAQEATDSAIIQESFPSATPVVNPVASDSAGILDELLQGSASGSSQLIHEGGTQSASASSGIQEIDPTLTATPTPESSARIRSPKLKVMRRTDYRASDVVHLEVNDMVLADIRVTVTDPKGKKDAMMPTYTQLADGVRLSFVPGSFLQPGKYSVTVHDLQTGTEFTQDFTWGVLAMNINRAIYHPNDTVHVDMAVLDDIGDIVCDAEVTLEVTDSGQAVRSFSTKDGTIRMNNADCVLDTQEPDYETEYQTGGTGRYRMLLTASTPRGTHSIEEAFRVEDNPPFLITRSGTTRVYPPVSYAMRIELEAAEDFDGVIEETVPERFIITPLEGITPYEDVRITSPDPDVMAKDPIVLGMPFGGTHPISQSFGERVRDPALSSLYQNFGLDGHDGVDFDMPVGTPVLATDEGIVAKVANVPYGTTVTLEHGWGKSYYGHLSEVLVRAGDTVTTGQEIARSGNTGITTAPHVHFGMKFTKHNTQNGYYGKIDPLPYLTSSAVYLSDTSVKTISWRVSVKKGETISLGYTYKVPMESPQFYLVGPLVLRRTGDKVSVEPAQEASASGENPFVLGVATETHAVNAGPVVYQELRQWQIAADAVGAENTAKCGTNFANSSTCTITLTVTNATLVVVQVATRNGNGAVNTTGVADATDGNYTEIAGASQGNTGDPPSIEQWYLNTPSGSQTITVTLNANDYGDAAATGYTGTHATTPIETASSVGTTGAASSATTNITCANSGSWSSSVVAHQDNGNPTETNTFLWESLFNSAGVKYSQAGEYSGTCADPSWSFAKSANYAISAVEINQAVAGPTLDQLLRHGAWFSAGVEQAFTF